MNFNFLGNILCSEIFYHDPRIHVDQTDEGNYEINQHFQSQINSEVNMIIKTAIHNYAEFFNVNKRNKLIKICKNNLKNNGVLIILSLNTLKNQIPCFRLMKYKLNKGLQRDTKMIKSICKILKNNKIDKFRFKVSITKSKYIKMLKKKYISCLVNLNKDQINKGIKEIKNFYPNKISFEDILICISYKK